jgi:hypothetical protein
MSKSRREPAPSPRPGSTLFDSPLARGVLGTFGACLLLLSMYLVALCSYELAVGPSETRPGVLVGLIVFFLGAGGAAVVLLQKTFLRRADRSATSAPSAAPPESRILALAQTRRGRITVPEVAANCGLSLDESKAQLDRLAVSGAADLHVTDNGVLVYVFSGFLSGKEKARAEDY